MEMWTSMTSLNMNKWKKLVKCLDLWRGLRDLEQKTYTTSMKSVVEISECSMLAWIQFALGRYFVWQMYLEGLVNSFKCLLEVIYMKFALLCQIYQCM